jgi:hypothetical protein
MKFLYRMIKILQKYRFKSFFILYISGFVLYFCQDECQHSSLKSVLSSLYNAAALFALDIRMPENRIEGYEYLIYFLALLAGLYTVLSVVEVFVKDKMHEVNKKQLLSQGEHIIVVGLGRTAKGYIDTLLKQDTHAPVILITQHREDSYFEHLDEKMVVERMDVQNPQVCKDLNLQGCEHVVIATDDDMYNLEVAMNFLSYDKNTKIFLQLEDRSLRYFHKENGLLSGKNIRIFSYYEDAARELFDQHDIDGIGRGVIQSNKPFAIAVVGNTQLSYEVIAQACIMGQLPNENPLTVYCIDKNVHSFKNSVELYFPGINDIPHVTLKYLDLDPEIKTFYQDSLWADDLTNIVLCFDNDQKNLDIASNLVSLTFIEKIVAKTMSTRIIMAISNGYVLGERIIDNQDLFKYLYTFGAIEKINQENYIVSGARDRQAIVTHYIYEHIGARLIDENTYTYEYFSYEEYDRTGFLSADPNDLKDEWYDLSYFKKESNRSVADHIRMKLKYLGLRPFKSDENDVRVLFSLNKILFDQKMNNKILLAKMEHNRWNAFHYLNGYTPIPFVSKEEKGRNGSTYELLKQHMCLVPFEVFKERADEMEGLGYVRGELEGYDFMINEHIPLILANAGYAIAVLES